MRKLTWSDRLWSNSKARSGLLLLAALCGVAFFGPLFVGDPSLAVAQPHLSPSWAHWFGTTGQGQDVFAQTVVGARPTLLVGFTVGLFVTVIGAIIGVTSGYLGGLADELMSALVNVFLVIPGLPLAIILAAYLPSGPFSLVVVLTLTGWAWTARVVRAQTLTLRSRDFIRSAQLIGEPLWRVILVELLPHMSSLLLSTFIGTTIYAIGAQVGLEFLGLGDMGSVTWGTNLYWAANDQALLTRAWWTYVPTGCGIAIVGFALALINFGLDEVTNPRLSVDRIWRSRLTAIGVKPSALTAKVELSFQSKLTIEGQAGRDEREESHR